MSAAPYYSDDFVTIYHCDVREMPRSEVACVVSSPPYNVGIEYDRCDDALSWRAYEGFAYDVAASLVDHLIAGGRVWWNVMPNAPSGEGDSRVNLAALWGAALEDATFSYRDTIVWWQHRADGGCAWGSWESPSGPNQRGEWEAILVYFRGRWLRSAPAGMESWRDPLGGWQHLCVNVWKMDSERRNGHPVPFPVKLPERAIRLSTWPGETVLDPFMGSGTTLRAAKDLGRKAIGCDTSERYCELAALRCGQEVLDFGASPVSVDAK